MLTVRGAHLARYLACAALLWAVAEPALAGDRYVRAAVDAKGRLRIETAGGRVITIKPDPEEVGFTKIAISPNGDAVGWVGLRASGSTSYDIPTRLVIFWTGGKRTFRGHELPVWKWAFAEGGTQVIFYQETIHGGLGMHHEWRDIASGRLIAEWGPEIEPDGRALPNQNPPAWVREFEREK